MTLFCWAISLVGLVMFSLGAYYLGRAAGLKQLKSLLAEANAELRRTQERLNLYTLEQDLSRNLEVSGETNLEPSGEKEKDIELASGGEREADLREDEEGFAQSQDSETRIVRVDAKAVMDAAEQDERNRFVNTDGRGEDVLLLHAEEPEMVHSDLTRRVTLDSSEEVLSLSRQVDLLTDDLSRLHKLLKEEKVTRRDLEVDSAARRRRIAELESLIQKQQQELKRRDERIKRLLSEVGVNFAEDDAVEETLDALACLDCTKETTQVDLADLEEMSDATQVNPGPNIDPKSFGPGGGVGRVADMSGVRGAHPGGDKEKKKDGETVAPFAPAPPFRKKS